MNRRQLTMSKNVKDMSVKIKIKTDLDSNNPTVEYVECKRSEVYDKLLETVFDISEFKLETYRIMIDDLLNGCSVNPANYSDYIHVSMYLELV